MNAPLRLTLFSGFSNLYEHCRHMPIYQWMNESISCFFVFVFVFYIIMPLSLQWSMIFRAPCMCVCMCVCLGSSCQCPGGGVAVWQMLRCSQRYFLPLSPPLTPPSLPPPPPPPPPSPPLCAGSEQRWAAAAAAAVHSAPCSALLCSALGKRRTDYPAR